MLRSIVKDYLKRSRIGIVPHLEIDNFAMAISLVTSTRGVALLPTSVENFLPWSVISRPLKGERRPWILRSDTTKRTNHRF